MAKKPPKQRAQIGILGKALTRRSRGKCELCTSRGSVRLYELAPFPKSPDPDRTLMACHKCRDWLDEQPFRPIEAHFLSTAVWSEWPAVRLAAARLLLQCDDPANPWLRDALDVCAIDPQTREFIS